MDRVRVALTGAAGQIGYHLAFSIARGEVFHDTDVDLVLVDLPHTHDAMRGLKMELEDACMPQLNHIEIYAVSELSSAFKDLDFAFLVGAFPRQKDMERRDLLEKNAAIFIEQGKALSQYAKTSCQVLVVGNPCNSNCLIALHHCKNIPAEQFYAMTMLDQNRAQAQLAIKANVKLQDVSDLYIYGNHSGTQFPDYMNAKIAGKSAEDVIDSQWLSEVFVPMIQQRGASVIKMRGASSAASAARAAQQTAECIWSKSVEPFSVAKISDGSYAAPKGVVVSMPFYFEAGRFVPKLGFTHSKIAQQYMKQSYDELEDERRQLVELGVL